MLGPAYKFVTFRRYFSMAFAVSLTSHSAAAVDIPSRVTHVEGSLELSAEAKVEISRTVAGLWGVGSAKLIVQGKPVWTSPPSSISLNGYKNEYKLLKVDLDGNGQRDWLLLYFPRTFAAQSTSSYEPSPYVTRNWSGEESLKALGAPWSNMLCVALGGLIVMDDQHSAFMFQYGPVPQPFQHRNPSVLGEQLYKKVLEGAGRSYILQQSQPIPQQIWTSIAGLVKRYACDAADLLGDKLPDSQKIQWNMTRQPFMTSWKPPLDEGLAMYRRALDYFNRSKSEVPDDERGTQSALAAFDFSGFFKTFPFDEMDRENVWPQYTAMLNDFCYYLMAPEDAQRAIGFQNRRTPVDQGVIAMLAHVIRRDPTRMVAYLNLADALWRNGKDDQAAEYYQQYLQKMKAAGKHRAVPARVIERSRITAASSSTLQP